MLEINLKLFDAVLNNGSLVENDRAFKEFINLYYKYDTLIGDYIYRAVAYRNSLMSERIECD